MNGELLKRSEWCQLPRARPPENQVSPAALTAGCTLVTRRKLRRLWPGETITVPFNNNNYCHFPGKGRHSSFSFVQRCRMNMHLFWLPSFRRKNNRFNRNCFVIRGVISLPSFRLLHELDFQKHALSTSHTVKIQATTSSLLQHLSLFTSRKP